MYNIDIFLLSVPAPANRLIRTASRLAMYVTATFTTHLFPFLIYLVALTFYQTTRPSTCLCVHSLLSVLHLAFPFGNLHKRMGNFRSY